LLDARRVAEVQRGSLDADYLRSWAGRLGVEVEVEGLLGND
jgi:hypothetical protein